MRSASAVLLCALVMVACKDKPTQSAKEAMQLLCDAYQRSDAENANPAQRAQTISQWVDKQVSNTEIRALFASLGSLRPSNAQAAVKQAADKHGVVPCPVVESLAPVLQLPTIATGGVLPIESETSMIVVTPHAVVVEGQSVVEVTDGAVNPAELEGGKLGMHIPRLTNFLEALRKQGGSPVGVAIDPTLSYDLLLRVLFSVKRAKIDRVQLLVTQRGVTKQIPIHFPERKPAAVGAPALAPESPPLRPVVSISRDSLALWSISGLEGTLASPKLVLAVGDRPDFAPLVRTLEEIIQRRHGSSARSAEDREIIAMFDPTTTMQTVAAVLAAVRATDDKVLFSELMLSAGFE